MTETVEERRIRRKKRRTRRLIRRLALWCAGLYVVQWVNIDSVQLYIIFTILWIIFKSLKRDGNSNVTTNQA